MNRLPLLLFWAILVVLVACGPEEIGSSTSGGEFTVDQIVSTTEQIVPDQPLPQFKEHFGTGTKVIYSYVWLKNSETMTGSFPVRLRWFSPNDFRPPIAQRVVELSPGQNVAQFSIHNDAGLPNGPYMLLARAGRKLNELTASGSSRFFVGMTPEEAKAFLDEEAEVRRRKDEERKLREEERKRKEEAEKQARIDQLGGLDTVGPLDELPPELTDGVGE